MSLHISARPMACLHIPVRPMTCLCIHLARLCTFLGTDINKLRGIKYQHFHPYLNTEINSGLLTFEALFFESQGVVTWAQYYQKMHTFM